jgi:hypothetical protein
MARLTAFPTSPSEFGRFIGEEFPTCTRAREERADRLFEELFEIADKPCTNQVEVQQQRNRLDTRKWALSKLAPRKYGIASSTTTRAG